MMEDASSACVFVTHVGDHDSVSGSWFPPGLDLAFAALSRVNQQIEALSLFLLTNLTHPHHSALQIN